MPTLLATKSALGVAARSGDPERILIARRDHAAAKIQSAIERTLADAPALSHEQADFLAGLLRTAGCAA